MKENFMANTEQYRAVLDDLLKQRNELQFKIGEIDAAVAALKRLMPAEQALPVKSIQIPMAINNGKYSGMSVRWAILCLLSEDATKPLTTGEIADALALGGITSKGKSFAANVSAVLSGMNRERDEVKPSEEGNGWIISESGKQAWIHIKASREHREPQYNPHSSLQ